MAADDAPIRRFTVEHGAAEVQRDPGARVLWPAVEVEEPVGAFLLSLSGAGRTVVHVEHGGALIRVVVERVEPDTVLLAGPVLPLPVVGETVTIEAVEASQR